MIEFKNTEVIRDLPFSEYLQIKAYSNSFLKMAVDGVVPEFVPSDKVKLGSMVDAILTDVGEVDLKSPFYRPAKKLAAHVATFFGVDLWNMFESQVSFTSEMVNDMGLAMKVKGRLDKMAPGRVIDLKITHAKVSQIQNLIVHMKYFEQMWLYSNAMSFTSNPALIFYSVPDDEVHPVFLDVSGPSRYYESKILLYGT